MTALAEVAAYVPVQRVTIESLAPELELTPMQVKVFQRYHGLSEVSRDPDRSLLDLLTCGTDRLSNLRSQRQRIRYVLYARSMPVVAPFPLNPLHELSARLGLDHAVAFTVTHQACASSLHAIQTAARYQEALARARSRLAVAIHGAPLRPGDQEGDDGGGFRWRVSVRPLANTAVRPFGMRDRDRPTWVAVALYDVSVRVWWTDRRGGPGPSAYTNAGSRGWSPGDAVDSGLLQPDHRGEGSVDEGGDGAHVEILFMRQQHLRLV